VEDDLAGVSVASRAEGPVPAADTTQPG